MKILSATVSIDHYMRYNIMRLVVTIIFCDTKFVSFPHYAMCKLIDQINSLAPFSVKTQLQAPHRQKI